MTRQRCKRHPRGSVATECLDAPLAARGSAVSLPSMERQHLKKKGNGLGMHFGGACDSNFQQYVAIEALTMQSHFFLLLRHRPHPTLTSEQTSELHADVEGPNHIHGQQKARTDSLPPNGKVRHHAPNGELSFTVLKTVASATKRGFHPSSPQCCPLFVGRCRFCSGGHSIRKRYGC